jgi:carbon storage regulator
MLVLSRRIGERIVVPHCDLTVTVIAIKGKAVRLGISAPDDIRVYRKEVTQQGKPEGSETTEQDNPRSSSSQASVLLNSVNRMGPSSAGP